MTPHGEALLSSDAIRVTRLFPAGSVVSLQEKQPDNCRLRLRNKTRNNDYSPATAPPAGVARRRVATRSTTPPSGQPMTIAKDRVSARDAGPSAPIVRPSARLAVSTPAARPPTSAATASARSSRRLCRCCEDCRSRPRIRRRDPCTPRCSQIATPLNLKKQPASPPPAGGVQLHLIMNIRLIL